MAPIAFVRAHSYLFGNAELIGGGSIGANPRLCFEKYVDSIIDLLIPGQSPGIKEKIVDIYGKPELLFFGPDEGTADMMDWAARKSRRWP